MKIRLIYTLFLLLSREMAFAQDHYSNFLKHFQAKDTAKQFQSLKEWEQSDPKNPELFTCYFNYYFFKSQKEILTISKNQPQGDGYVLKDSSHKTAGYIGSQFEYDEPMLRKGFHKIDKGIKLYPNRLDMRFGKIYALGKIKRWDDFTKELLKTIQYSSKNGNNWTWKNNEKKENGKIFFLSSIQDYQVQLFNTGSDDLLKNMRDIANEVLRFYPDHVESLSNLSITYIILKEYDRGIEALLKAEEISPNDAIVLSNIAHAYKEKGENAKAIEYYNKILKVGNPEEQKYATQQIGAINK